MLYTTLPGFLGASAASGLLKYTLDHQERLTAPGVGPTSAVRAEIRRSRTLGDQIGGYETMLRQRVLAVVPELIERLGVTAFAPTGVEVELVAHEHGAFYKRHVDLYTGGDRQVMRSDRLISVVYYFNREPRAFAGGELRIYPEPWARQGGPEHYDIAPANDLAVAFPSWVPHQVMPIDCASRRLEDARFAINCWVLRALPA